jgi:hypothetical protein
MAGELPPMVYAFLKDFGGPIATVIAALAAVIVTGIFSAKQTAIARSQKDIALDKLKFDLFQQRYEIFTAADQLIDYVISRNALKRMSLDEKKDHFERVLRLRAKLREAGFFFGPEIRGYLDEVNQTCGDVLDGEPLERNAKPDDPKWQQGMKKYSEAVKKLGGMWNELPAKLENALRFDQLTRD